MSDFPTCMYAGADRQERRIRRGRPAGNPDRYCNHPTIGNGGLKCPAECIQCIREHPEFAMPGKVRPISPKGVVRCGSCGKRKRWLNKLIPGLGTATAWAIEASGVGKLFGKASDDAPRPG